MELSSIIFLISYVNLVIFNLYLLSELKIYKKANQFEKNHVQILRERYVEMFRLFLAIEHPLTPEDKAELTASIKKYEEFIVKDLDLTEIKKCLK